jgi:hypothetical protein
MTNDMRRRIAGLQQLGSRNGGQHKLPNLTHILDNNTLQRRARVAGTNDVERLVDKFCAFSLGRSGRTPAGMASARSQRLKEI